MQYVEIATTSQKNDKKKNNKNKGKLKKKQTNQQPDKQANIGSSVGRKEKGPPRFHGFLSR